MGNPYKGAPSVLIDLLHRDEGCFCLLRGPLTHVSALATLCSQPTADGGRCRFPAGRGTDHQGTGPCSLHDSQPETVKHSKKEFTELVRGGRDTFHTAAKKVGVTRVTIWRWRRQDPDFDREVVWAAGEVAAERLDAHEVSLYSRIMRGEAPAGLEIFWMLNMAAREAAMNQAGSRRWEQPTARHEVTGRNGAPVQADVKQHVMIYIPDNGRSSAPLPEFPQVDPPESRVVEAFRSVAGRRTLPVTAACGGRLTSKVSSATASAPEHAKEEADHG